MEIFLDDEDREVYLELLQHYREQYDIEIFAYCLMSNHIHLVAVPKEDSSLARMLAGTHMRYAQHVNWKYSQSGHLWQGRFFSCVLDERHTLAAALYVERNPVRAGLVGHPWDYRWSSARGHVGQAENPILSTEWPTRQLISQWAEFLIQTDDASGVEEIRSSTRRGRPLGSSGFVSKLEQLFGRDLAAKKRGRPRKQKLRKQGAR